MHRQIRESAAGLLDDHGERRDVEDVHVGFDHHVERGARQQMVMHEIAIAADSVDAADQPAKTRPGREMPPAS